MRKLLKGEQRTLEQIREHYEIEKELAYKLRHASKSDRRILYASVYNELFQRVTLHPQLTRKVSPIESKREVDLRMRFLHPFLRHTSVFLEVGPGDCALSIEVAKFVNRVYAVDVSEEITKMSSMPSNFQLILSDGSSIPVPANSIDVAYSDQLMEHLHPDDALEQLQNIYHCLVPGGVYICITPNGVAGPHDVSMYFDKVAAGFHLKEYTTLELSNLFKKVGFSHVKAYVGTKQLSLSIPVFLIGMFEKLLTGFLYVLRSTLVPSFSFSAFPNIRMVGIK